MLLKILLLQVMSIGLITVPIKAQDTLSQIPDLYMEDSDKAVMNSIWNIAGFPSDQDGPTEVDRKFFTTLGHVVPVLQQPIVQQIPVVSSYLPGTINAIGPGYTTSVSTVVPGYGGVVPSYGGVVPSYGGVVPGVAAYPYNPQPPNYNDNKQNKEIHQAGGSYHGSPTTINYKVLPKPPNSELDSSEEEGSPLLINNRRTLQPENADLEITDVNAKETNAVYDSTENLETDSRDLNSADLVMEQLERMMQFEGADDNILMNNKPRNFLQRKPQPNINGGIQSHDTNTDVENRSSTHKNNIPPDGENATINRNSQMGMHKKKHNRKNNNTSRNSETSTRLPTVANRKNTGKRKESIRKSNKTPETRKYYEMLDNNQKYLCKCDIMSEETMKDSKPRRRNRELNERSMDIRHERPFNCTKYCSVTEENADKTKDKDNLRIRSRHNMGVYHKDKRNNVEDDPAEKESVEPKVAHARNYRNKHTINSYVDDSSYRSMRNVNPSEYAEGSSVEALDNVEGYNSMIHQYPKSNLIQYETLKRL